MAIWTKALLALAMVAGAAHADEAINCASCAQWNAAQAPFQVVGNTWYVGPAGLSAILVTSPQGHILIDGALPQSAAQIIHNITVLGFSINDVRLILSSHPHWDHAGGIAALQRASGATVVASAAGAQVLKDGTMGPDDPQFDAAEPTRVGKIAKVRVVADGEVVRLGTLALTAHATPGHTAGGVTWTWQSCEDGLCSNVVYADSLNPVSRDGYRFSDAPQLVATFAASTAKVAALPCDVLLSVHPGVSHTLDKLAATTRSHNAFLDGGCKAYAAEASALMAARLASEAAHKPAPVVAH